MKTVLITGATDGIGKQTAIELAKLGYNIGLVGRSKKKTEIVLDQIASKSGNHSLKYFIADLSNIKTLNTLANSIHNEYESIDILINNAGAYFSQYIETKENIEKTFALNHLNYFRLTHLLMDIIKIDLPGRVINVASSAHFSARLDINDIQMSKGYKGWTAYCNSKLMNILFTYEIHKRHKETGITFNALHPGFVDTRFGDNNTGLGKNILSIGKKLIAINVVKGAITNVYLASSDEVKNLSYEDLSNEVWKERIVIRSSNNIYNQSLVASLISNLGIEQTEKWAKGLVSNFARKPQGNDRSQILAVANGEADIAIANSYYYGLMLSGSVGQDQQNAAKKVKMLFPNQNNRGTHVNISGAGILKFSKNQKNAEVFLEFLLSPEVQEHIVNNTFEYPIIDEISPSPFISQFGISFLQDQTPASDFGKFNSDSIKLMDRAGWK